MHQRKTREGIELACSQLFILRLHFAGVTGLYRFVAQGNGERGCALKHIELPGLLRDLGNHLNTRRTGTDYRDPFAREGWLLCWPAAGEVLLAGEIIQPVEPGLDGCRDQARSHNAKSCRHAFAGICLDQPTLGTLIKMRGGDAGFKLNIASQIEALCDVVGVALYLRLTGIALAPVPLLFEFFGEGVGVLDALNIHTSTGVAIPVPGATLALSNLITLNGEATLPCAIDHIEAGKTRADNDHIDIFNVGGGGHCDLLFRHRFRCDTIPAPERCV